MSVPPSICFVAPQAGAALQGASGVAPGGAELQQARLGRELTRRGHEVTFVIDDPGWAAGRALDDVDGMRVVAVAGAAGLAGPRRFGSGLVRGWRLARGAAALWRAMERAHADVYTVRSNHLTAALAGIWCRARGRPLVFAAGHDGNCDLDRTYRRPRRAVALLYAAALRGAAAVVAQSEPQREMLRAGFGVGAIVIPSLAPPELLESSGPREGVFWAGAIEPRKGPDRLLEIARKIPGVAFTMVGGAASRSGFHDRIRAEAGRLPNVSWRGELSREQTLDLFARAAIYVNTSRTEGFPNTFLDAWRAGAPVVSLNVDPDGPGALERAGVGLVTHDTQRAARVILDLLGDPRRRDAMARAGLERLAARHAPGEVASMWESALEEAAASPGAGARPARAGQAA